MNRAAWTEHYLARSPVTVGAECACPKPEMTSAEKWTIALSLGTLALSAMTYLHGKKGA